MTEHRATDEVRRPRYNARAMSPLESRSTFESRVFVRLGLALWLLAAVACVWEVLALQPPDSPLHWGVLAGPVAQLRTFAFALGTGALALGPSWPMLFAEGEGRALVLVLMLGAMLQLSGLLYAASRGLMAVQIFDPRPDARLALYARALGHALLLLGLGSLLTRAMRSRRVRPA